MSKQVGSWQLICDVWIPSWSLGRSEDSQLLTGHLDTCCVFNQMLIQSQSELCTINRILYWDTVQNCLTNVTLHQREGGCTGELHLPSDTVVHKTNGAAPNWRFPEWHQFNKEGGRLIFRRNQIHCAADYARVGGQENNPRLGQWGRVFVRTVPLSSSSLCVNDIPDIACYPYVSIAHYCV